MAKRQDLADTPNPMSETRARPHPGGPDGGDASLTGRESPTSRNTPAPAPPQTETPAEPAKAERQPGKDENGKDLPTLETYPDKGDGLQEICLDGGGSANGAQYMIGKPIPQDLTVNKDTYNLSDRAKGLYTYRVR